MKLLAKIFFAFTLYISNSYASSSPWQAHEISGVKTSLIGSYFVKNGHRNVILGIEFKINDGWKIYGNDSNGIGSPPTFNFSNSQNYDFHNVIFPPSKTGTEEIGQEKINYNYYSDDVIIPVIVELKDQNLDFKVVMDLNFAVCKDVCVPVSQNFSLDLANKIDNTSLGKIEKYFGSKLVESNLNLNFEDVDMSLNINKENNISDLFVKIILAVIGGFILNIMPCVLPVLSIKLMTIIKQSGASQEKIKKGFIATIIGIAFCFIILALVTYSLKAVGSNLGWGFQFQNPYFIIFLIIILILFTAELVGFFELTYSQFLATILNKKISQQTSQNNIFVPNFLSGILAVLLATPCSAPFLGSAISFALTQNFISILTIFFFIGVGFSMPYILLILFPNCLKYFPKPGTWMQKTKQILAGFLFATSVWLTYVLCNIIGYFPGIVTGILALILFFSFKIKEKFIKNILILFLIITSFVLPIEFYEWEVQKKQEFNSLWNTFDESLLSSQVAKGKVILVDVTADWCITCKFNKIMILNSEEINTLLKSGEIIGFRADITKPDDEVMKFMAKYDRYAIPFNIVYGPNAQNGILMSELLNKKEILEAIKKAK